MGIFIKVIEAVSSDKQLSVELAKIQPVKIEGSSAEKIVKNLEELLGEKDSFKIIAGANIFSDELILMEEIFDTFEIQDINDMAYYYQIHKSSPEQKDFEIYCQSGTSIEIKRI